MALSETQARFSDTLNEVRKPRQSFFVALTRADETDAMFNKTHETGHPDVSGK